jgi:hypothetical protein
MRVQFSSLTLLTRYRTKFRGFLGEAYPKRRTAAVNLPVAGVMALQEGGMRLRRDS